MIHELKCRHCSWESDGYSDNMTEWLDKAKEHAKNHKTQWKYWAYKGKVLWEMFTVVSKVSEEST